MQHISDGNGDPIPSILSSDKRRDGGTRNSWASWSRGGRQRRSREEEIKREEQLLAYMAWVNSQLKKRPGSRHLQSLPRDMQDGVALLQLIQVVAGENLVVDESPSSYQAMKDNVDRVLQFMSAQRIKMHHVSSKDIVEGNVKATMRLILALAAHFKPGSVKQRQHQPQETTVRNKVTRTPSAAAAAAEAAATIGEASRAAASIGRQFSTSHRPRVLFSRRKTPKEQRTGKSPRDVSSTPKIEQISEDCGPSGYTTPVHGSIPERQQESESQKSSSEQKRSNQTDSSAPGSGSATPRLQATSSGRQSPCHQRCLSDAESIVSKASLNDSIGLTQEFVNEVTDGYDSMEDDLLGTKEMLLQLQEMLLEGRVADDEVSEEECHLEASNIQEKLTIVMSRLSLRDAEYDHLKTELNSCKQKCINLQGVKSGLMSRLNQQDQSIMHFKTELLQHGFSRQQQMGEAEELQRRLEERDRVIAAVHAELARREQASEQQRVELVQALQCIEELRNSQANQRPTDDMHVYELQQKIQDMQEKLESVGISEADLSSRIALQDEKMGVLSHRILHGNQTDEGVDVNSNQSNQVLQRAEEMEIVREAMKSLRICFDTHDHHHHILDTLEQIISNLVDRHPRPAGSLSSKQDFNGFDRYNGHYETLDGTFSAVHDSSGVSTKVLYFTEWTVTPFLTSIPKKLGEVTLADFKQVFDRPGPYRYHFKALDPEFGTVKEEVVDDHRVVPGWEGKIVGWIEEDVGQRYLADDMA